MFRRARPHSPSSRRPDAVNSRRVQGCQLSPLGRVLPGARRKNGLMLIVMAGLPGSGKGTVAEELAKSLRCACLSVDPIEGAMWRAGVERSQPTGLAAYVVAEDLAREQLLIGSGCRNAGAGLQGSRNRVGRRSSLGRTVSNTGAILACAWTPCALSTRTWPSQPPSSRTVERRGRRRRQVDNCGRFTPTPSGTPRRSREGLAGRAR